MTPEQICLSFLKAVEKAKQNNSRLIGHAVCNDVFYSLEPSIDGLKPAGSPATSPDKRIEVGLGEHSKTGFGYNMLYHEKVRPVELLSQEETAARLLSMIKELEVYGIKLEEV